MSERTVLFLYGSQTGAAKSIAESLHTDAASHGFASRIAPLNDYAAVGFLTASPVVMVCSTTGNGDPPNNAEDFWRFIRRRTHANSLLAAMHFTMLGLGDTNYDKFCNVAKVVHKRMLDLGAREFYHIGTADEATGLDGVVEPWIKGFWPALQAHFSAITAATSVPAPVLSLPPAPVVASTPAPAPGLLPPADVVPVRAAAGGDEAPATASLRAPAVAAAAAASETHSPMSLLHSLLPTSAHLHEADGIPPTVAALPPHDASANAPPLPTLPPPVSTKRSASTASASHLLSPTSHHAWLPHVPAYTLPAGVRAMAELLPAIRCCAQATASDENLIPPAPVSAAVKFFPKPPPLTVSVQVSDDAIDTVGMPALGSPLAGGVEGSHGAPPPLPSLLTATTRASSTGSVHSAGASGSVAGGASAGGVGGGAGAAPGGSTSSVGKSADAPVTAVISNARYLTSGGAAAERRVILMELDVSGTQLQGNWNPGDSIGIIVPNEAPAVVALCARLGYAPTTRISISSLSKTGTQAAPAVGASTASDAVPACGVPTWLREAVGGDASLIDILLWCYDVQQLPKKAFLRMLGDYASGEDRDRLYYLAGRQGRNAYMTFIEQQRLSLVELLSLFPSCKPTLAALFSALPPLMPRYYSIASSAVGNPCAITVAFTVVTYACTVTDATTAGAPLTCILRRGLATNYLERLASPYLMEQAPSITPTFNLSGSGIRKHPSSLFASALGAAPSTATGSLACDGASPMALHASPTISTADVNTLAGMLAQRARVSPHLATGMPLAPAPATDASLPADSAARAPHVRIFLRPSREFSLPPSPDKPLIMIGPGTGVAPFVGFLHHRASRCQTDAADAVAVCTGQWRAGCQISTLREDSEFYTPLNFGQAYLFFGNRRRDEDYLFQEELAGYLSAGVLTRLIVAWSREGPEKVYVTHRMREYGALLADLIVAKGAYVYVCGDGAAMAKDVHTALVDVLRTHGGADTNSDAAAELLLQTMTSRGRYVRDVWS